MGSVDPNVSGLDAVAGEDSPVVVGALEMGVNARVVDVDGAGVPSVVYANGSSNAGWNARGTGGIGGGIV